MSMASPGQARKWRGAHLDPRARHPYIAHMKRVTASEARKSWFRLLDEVAAGEVVLIDRKGTKVILRRADKKGRKRDESVPDYRTLLKVPHEERADTWSWEWTGPESELRLREDSAR